MNRSSQTDLDMADIALINAMDYYKSFPFNFNHGWETVHLAADQEFYSSHASPPSFPSMRVGTPYGLQRPIVIQIVGTVTSGDVLTGEGSFSYSATGGDPLKQISAEEMASMHQGIGDVRLSTGAGLPEYFTWMGNGTIRLYPVPRADLLAAFYFIRDSLRPRYRWTAGAWAFEQLELDTGTGTWSWMPLDPGFTNLWLEHAESLIRAWARKELSLNFYSDAGAAQVAAAALREQEQRFTYEYNTGMLGTAKRKPSCL